MTSSLSSSALAALSTDESLVAVVIPSSSSNQPIIPKNGLRIAIWSIYTKTIQCTLHYNNNNNTDDENEKHDVFRKILFLNNNNTSKFVAAVFTKTIIIWDLNRGIVSCTITEKKKKNIQFLDAASSSGSSIDDDGSTILYVLTNKLGSSKLLISEYDVTKYNNNNGTELRKVKVGKLSSSSSSVRFSTSDEGIDASAKLAVLNDLFIVLSPSTGLRVFNRTDGSKISKISESKLLSMSNISHHDSSNTSLSVTETNMPYAATVCQGKVVLMDVINGHIVQGLTIVAPSTITDGTSAPSVQLIHKSSNNSGSNSKDDDDGSRFYLLVNNKYLYEISIIIITDDNKENASYYKIMKKTDMHIQADLVSCLLFVLSSGTFDLLGIVSNAKGQYQLQTISSSNKNNDKLSITWQDALSEKKKHELNSDLADDNQKKRKHGATSILGPGHVGGEARGIVDVAALSSGKRKKKDDDDNNDETPNVGGNNEDDDRQHYQDTMVVDRLDSLQQLLDEEDERIRNKEYNTYIRYKSIAEQKKLSVQSLTELIQQAIVRNPDDEDVDDESPMESDGNDDLFEIAFTVKDPKLLEPVIRERLSPSEIAIVLQQLTNRLLSMTTTNNHKKQTIPATSTNPYRINQLGIWITAICRYGGEKIINPIQQLQPLSDLLYERLSYYPELLKLEGQL